MLYCDNEGVVQMINSSSSKCKNCMVLIRAITLQCLIYNVRLYARHLRTDLNSHADALSRGNFNKFVKLSRELKIEPNQFGEDIPLLLQDIEEIWLV